MIKNITLLLVMVGAYSLWTSSPIEYGPGEIVTDAPVIEDNLLKDVFKKDNYTISPVKRIDIKARVLSQERYFFDNKSAIAPFDFVIGWGPMSDETHLNEITINQNNRTQDIELLKPKLPLSEIKKHISLIHTVPSNPFIADDLKRVRIGHIIHIKGYIVDIKESGGWMWKSSFDDVVFGNGSEIIWIEDFSVM